MEKFQNNKTNQGLTSVNQTKSLVRMENGEIKVYTNEKVQEVLIHTNRQGLTNIVNTILMNIGESRRISSKDNFERIESLCDYIYFNLKVNLYHLMNWDECGDKNLLKQKRGLLKNEVQEVFVQEIKRVQRNDYFLKLFITSDNIGLWKEIIKHFPYTEWIIDINQVGDGEFLGDNIQCGSLLFFNDGQDLGYNSCESTDFDTMEQMYPIHFGLKKNFILMTEIHNDQNRREDISPNNYPMDIKFFDKVISVSDSSEYFDLIQDKIRMYNINVYKWKGLLLNLKSHPNVINVIDSFSPYYFDLLEDRKVG